MVEIRHFIYPYYSAEIERELVQAGFTYAYSYGKTIIGRLRVIGKGKTGIIALVEPNKVLKIRRTDSPKESL
ncbi:serine/threonine protein kinase, partial [Sulfolobus sp. D5]